MELTREIKFLDKNLKVTPLTTDSMAPEYIQSLIQSDVELTFDEVYFVYTRLLLDILEAKTNKKYPLYLVQGEKLPKEIRYVAPKSVSSADDYIQNTEYVDKNGVHSVNELSKHTRAMILGCILKSLPRPVLVADGPLIGYPKIISYIKSELRKQNVY